MRRFVLILLLIASPVVVWGEERQGLRLVLPQPMYAERITATGRVYPLVSARLGARVSGHIAEFGKNESGEALEVGMRVKAGQVLFRLDQTTFLNAKAMAEAALGSARANLENLRARTREEQLEQLRQAVAELDARIANSKRDEARYRRLVEVEKTLPAVRLEEVQTQLAVLEAQRKAAEARLREAENGPTRTQIAVAEARVKEAEAALKMAEDDLRDATVRAPFDGVITRRFKGPGDYISSVPQVEVLEVVSLEELEAELHLPEAYFGGIEEGVTPIAIRSPLLGEELKTRITRVVSEIDTSKGTFAVRVAIPREGRGKLVAGAFVTAEVELNRDRPSVIVPMRAVTGGGGKAAVFVAEGDKMVRREVELGDQLTEAVIVRSGLDAGQRVIVGPVDELKDGEALPGYLRGDK